MINKLKNISIALLSFAMMVGCDSLFDVNEDPNNPTDANVEQILPVAQAALAGAFGDDYNFVACMWAQYWTSGQTIALTQLENFTMLNSNIRDAFNQAYARTLTDLQVLTKSEETLYSGIAKIMTAYTMQVLVDLHGDVPYSEAISGSIEDGGIAAPKYDDDQEIYDQLIPLIDEALTELEASSGLLKQPGSEDLVYSGDLENWKAFANTLKLRILVRQSQVDGAKLQAALDLMNSGVDFIDESNPAEIYFDGSTNGTSYPFYARFESRTATGMYMRASQTSIQYLLDTFDPRLSKIYDEGTEPWKGYNQGQSQLDYAGQSDNEFAQPNSDYVYASDVNFIMISAWDSKFMQAEVLARTGNPGAEALWGEAIQASMNYFDVSAAQATGYINNQTFGATLQDQLESIALQKWVAHNGTEYIESWIEARRFDVETTNDIIFRGAGGLFYTPSGTSLPANTFPSRFLYSQTEVDLNPNTPSGLTVTDKVFWDN